MQHPDEGTIHAWLDGQLAIDEANEISSHLSDCPECAALVAEARGLVAASTRILTALDDVPAGVLPASAEKPPRPVVGRRWYQRTDIRAAAALIFVAGGTLLVVRRGEQATFSPQAMTVAQQTGSGDTVATTSGKVGSAPIADKLTTSNAAVPAAPMRAHVQGPATASRASDAAVGIAEKAGAPAPVLAPTPAPVNAAAKAASPPAVVGESNRLMGRRPTGAFEALSSGTTNLAIADEIGAASLRVVRVDSSATTKQTVYEVTPGVQVTLAEVPVETAMEKSMGVRESARRATAMAPQRPPAETDQKPADSTGRAGGAPRDAVGGALGVVQAQRSAPVRANVAEVASVPPAAVQPPVKTITWTTNGRRYSLSGPLTEAQLERLRPLVMKLAAR